MPWRDREHTLVVKTQTGIDASTFPQGEHPFLNSTEGPEILEVELLCKDSLVFGNVFIFTFDELN